MAPGAKGQMDRAGLLFMQHERCQGEVSGTTQTVGCKVEDSVSTVINSSASLQQAHNLCGLVYMES